MGRKEGGRHTRTISELLPGYQDAADCFPLSSWEIIADSHLTHRDEIIQRRERLGYH